MLRMRAREPFEYRQLAKLLHITINISEERPGCKDEQLNFKSLDTGFSKPLNIRPVSGGRAYILYSTKQALKFAECSPYLVLTS